MLTGLLRALHPYLKPLTTRAAAERAADELVFCHHVACALGSIFAWMELLGREDVNARQASDDEEHWRDVTIELDEPLPALVRDHRLAGPLCKGCVGWSEATLRTSYQAEPPREVWTRARYEDVFLREDHFGWPVPNFATWAKRQRYEG